MLVGPDNTLPMMRSALGTLLLAAILASPLTASAQSFVPIPSDRLALDSSAPVSVSDVTLGLADHGKHLRICFAFRNVASAPIESAEFHVALLDQFDSERLSTNVTRNAQSQFSPGRRIVPPDTSASGYADTNDGSQSCWTFASESDASSLQGINNDLKVKVSAVAVRFADGTTWHRGDTFSRAYNADGSAYVLQPERFDTTWDTEPDSAPVAVVGSSIRSYATFDNKAKFEDCTTFRTITNKAASSIRMVYYFSNADGKYLPASEDWNYTFEGTYTPPVLIQNKCWHGDLPPVSVVRSMRHELVRVTQVRFTDGTSWKRGDGWTKAYAADGSRLSSPLAMVGASPAPDSNNNNSVTPAPQNVGGIGGVIGPSGQLYGEVAWDMSFDGGYGIALNQRSAFDAQYEAMSQCKSRAGANANNCVLIAQGKALNSPSTRCVTLISDGHVYRLGVGATQDDADLNALNTLHAAGGMADQAKTIVKGCNNN